ncbi:MAG: globin-coupled sensor protein, partial [Kurthia sp.]|nr:globin-coupled sensor protein [Kurthia sp.]
MIWNRSKKTKNETFFDIEQYKKNVKIDLSHNQHLQKQIELLSLTLEDLAIIHQLKFVAADTFVHMTDAFYDAIVKAPELTHMISQNSSIDRLKVTLTKHISEMFDGRIDAQYIEQRKIIAHVHVKIGLPSKWYLNSFQSLTNSFIDFIEDLQISTRESAQAIKAFTKLINFEQQIVIEAYENRVDAIRDEHGRVKQQVIHTVQNTSEELNAISEETTAAIQSLSRQADEIASSTKQGLDFVNSTKEKSENGRALLHTQNELMQKM